MTLSQDTAVPDYDLVYTVDRKGHGPWLISAHRLASGDNAAKTDVKTLFTSKEAISSVKTMEAGRVVVATSGTRLIIGFSEDPSPSLLKETAYTWRIIECPEWIVSMDVRARPLENVQKEYKGGKRQVENIDIAVGGLKGSIHLYEDLLRKLIRSDRRPSKDESGEINSRRLHWHRNAVLTVKWSVDGEYAQPL